MKRLLIVFIFLPLLFASQAQSIKEANVPEKVKKAFSNYYPEASNIKWNKDKRGFEVNFKLEDMQASLVLNPDGKLLETKTTALLPELPQNLLDYISVNYKDYKIENQEKIVDYEGTIIYKISLSKRKLQKILLFTDDGHLFKNNH